MTSTTEPTTKILIVGGGIAGLAAAIALRAPSRQITLLERSRFLRETGALISLQPNASKILNAWDLGQLLANSKPLVDRAFRICDAAGNVVNEIPLDTARFGADRVLFHRQDLHAALLRAATTEERPGRPVEVVTGKQVVKCDAEEGVVVVESGETYRGDIVVGADGVKSSLREFVVGERRDAVPTGISAYRLLLERRELDGIELPPGTLNPERPLTTMMIGHDKRIIMGPGRGGELLGIVALVPDDKMQEESHADSWVAEGSVDKLVDAFEDFAPWVLEVFKRASDVALWQLRDIEPLPNWVRGRTILIGDAAHGMLPTQGQGASQSFEDAEALQAFLADVSSNASASEVNRVLNRVFEARYERATLIQKYSRQQARPGTSADFNSVKLNPAEFMEYNCSYNGARDWLAKRKAKAI